MKRKIRFAVISLALVCAMLGGYFGGMLATGVSAEGSTEAESTTTTTTTTVIVTSPFTAAVAEVYDSVVMVNNYQTVRYNGYGFGGQSSREVIAGFGSGVVIADHYVLTNYHVIEDASSLKIAVKSDSGDSFTEYDCSVAAYDAALDAAVLFCPALTLAPVTLGDSDSLQLGDWAICVGNPISESFYRTVTTGVVSGLNRSIPNTTADRFGRRSTTNINMIQVDADINSGNSGGGMFNVSGELVGIPTMKYSTSTVSGTSVDGINLCIPINSVKPLIASALGQDPDTLNPAQASQATSVNLVGRPRLGALISQLNTDSYAIRSGAIPGGVYVREVEAGSPAESAGLLAGDIVVEANGAKTTTVTELQSIIAAHGAGDAVVLRVYRAEGMADAVENGGNIPGTGEYLELTVILQIIDKDN